ncbi:MAG: hypothetical protein IJN57_05660 [Oscillospiraceae bacterium]|nr:hypothetical protein [Oscillospiraceae bacterium]
MKDKKTLAILALPICTSLGICIGLIFGAVSGNMPMGSRLRDSLTGA